MNIRELLIKIGVDARGTTSELDKIDRKADQLKSTFMAVGQALAAFAAGATIRNLIQIADSMQNLQSRIGSATGDIAGANAMLDELSEHASTNRMDVNAYADSWAKFEVGMRRMGYQASDTTQLVDGLSAAFRVNGTEGNTAAGALFQLTQSISSGVVQMEELNSLADAQGPLFVDVAEAIGGTVPAFKKMVSQGKVTSQMLADSIIKQTRKYIDQLREMPLTLGDVWTVMLNDVKTGINNLNDSTSTIPRTAKTLMDAWNWLKKSAVELTAKLGGPGGLMDTIINMATPLATLLGGFLAFKALSFLTTPIGLVLGLAAAIGVLYDDYKTWKDGGESLIDWSKWEPDIQAALRGIGWVIDKFKELTGTTSDIEAAFNGLALVIGSVWATKFARAVASAFTVAGTAARNTPLGAIIFGSMAAGDVVFGAADKFAKSQWGEETTGSGLTERHKGSLVDKAFNLFGGGQSDSDKTGGGIRWNTNSPGYDSPKTLPGAGGQTVNNISAPVTMNVTQLPGEDSEALAKRVAQLIPSTQGYAATVPGLNANNMRDVNGDVK